MRGRALLSALVTIPIAAGCVYYNSIYNAERAYETAESHRRAGRDSLARAFYDEAIADAAEGYRRDPDGEWADDALFILALARLRLGENAEALEAFDAAASAGDGSRSGPEVLVYRGLAAAAAGDRERALDFANRALATLQAGPELAEGHLLRARILLEEGQTDAGWWDLDRAQSLDRALRTEAALARLRWAVHYGEPGRAGEALRILLGEPGAAPRIDSLAVLSGLAATRWGPAAAAGLLSPADSTRWGRVGRARVMLLRADLLDQAGDDAGASRVALGVAGGVGEGAAEARVWLARLRLRRANDLAELAAARAVLLPASDYPSAAALLERVEEVVRLSELGIDEPLGWFAAAESARTELAASALARGLYLAYADSDPSQPWAAKALLAAIAVTTDEGDRAWLRGRLEVHRESPYVLAARGAAAPGFEALEEDLALRLRAVRGR